MDRPELIRAVEKLAHAGAQAGLSVKEMIRILNAGVTVEGLIYLIEENLSHKTRLQ